MTGTTIKWKGMVIETDASMEEIAALVKALAEEEEPKKTLSVKPKAESKHTKKLSKPLSIGEVMVEPEKKLGRMLPFKNQCVFCTMMVMSGDETNKHHVYGGGKGKTHIAHIKCHRMYHLEVNRGKIKMPSRSMDFNTARILVKNDYQDIK